MEAAKQQQEQQDQMDDDPEEYPQPPPGSRKVLPLYPTQTLLLTVNPQRTHILLQLVQVPKITNRYRRHHQECHRFLRTSPPLKWYGTNSN
jgi:hypothetical protein